MPLYATKNIGVHFGWKIIYFAFFMSFSCLEILQSTDLKGWICGYVCITLAGNGKPKLQRFYTCNLLPGSLQGRALWL